MENSTNEQNEEKLLSSVISKQFKFEEEYNGQNKKYSLKQWKNKIKDKYGNNGNFYYCKKDNIYFYDTSKKIKNIESCPICSEFICLYCGYLAYKEDAIYSCCFRRKIKYIILYDINKYIVNNNDLEKPNICNYVPFANCFTFIAFFSNFLFWKADRYKNGKNIGIFEDTHRNHKICIILTFINVFFGFVIAVPFFFHHYFINFNIAFYQNF